MGVYLRALLLLAGVVGCLSFSLYVQASIVLEGSRVIYNEQDREVTIKLKNEGERPSVVQSWIDSGDVMQNPGLIKVPFLLTPPMIRVDPGKGQALRIIYTREKLLADRESVFFLNVLDIPAKVKSLENQNMIQLAIRTRVKVFFRPENLQGSADEAPLKLSWQLVKASNVWELHCQNNSDFHVSMANISLTSEGHGVAVGEGMVAPHEKKIFALGSRPATTARVKFLSIDDFGAAREQFGELTSN